MQDRDAARELAQRGVGACQALGEGGTCGNIVVDELEDLLEQLGREVLVLIRGFVIGLLWLLRLNPIFAVAVVLAIALFVGFLFRTRKGNG